MTDGPTLRLRMASAAVNAASANVRVKDLRDKTYSPVWWIRWNAKLRLPFAEARKRKHERAGVKAKQRLWGMVI